MIRMADGQCESLWVIEFFPIRNPPQIDEIICEMHPLCSGRAAWSIALLTLPPGFFLDRKGDRFPVFWVKASIHWHLQSPEFSNQ